MRYRDLLFNSTLHRVGVAALALALAVTILVVIEVLSPTGMTLVILAASYLATTVAFLLPRRIQCPHCHQPFHGTSRIGASDLYHLGGKQSLVCHSCGERLEM